MKRINALKIRNHFGEVLDMLDRDKTPILIEKRKKIRAVLIPYDEFRLRFLDKLLEDERDRFKRRVEGHVRPSLQEEDPTEFLRSLRGYRD